MHFTLATLEKRASRRTIDSSTGNRGTVYNDTLQLPSWCRRRSLDAEPILSFQNVLDSSNYRTIRALSYSSIIALRRIALEKNRAVATSKLSDSGVTRSTKGQGHQNKTHLSGVGRYSKRRQPGNSRSPSSPSVAPCVHPARRCPPLLLPVSHLRRYIDRTDTDPHVRTRPKLEHTRRATVPAPAPPSPSPASPSPSNASSPRASSGSRQRGCPKRRRSHRIVT